MNAVDLRVRDQWLKFVGEVPSLLATDCAGKWVVYRDGVQRVFDAQGQAYGWGLDTYGVDGGFVVARVETPRPILLAVERLWPEEEGR